MAIPDYESLMLPLLICCEDGKEHSVREVVEALAQRLNLTDEEQRRRLPSGQQTLFYDRLSWARTYVKHAGLLETTRRGHFRITEAGLSVLEAKPPRIDADYLDQFEAFRLFRERARQRSTGDKGADHQEKTPIEMLESAYQGLRGALANDLLQKIKVCPPSLFERVVVDLLVGMGYGGSRKDAGQAIGKAGDEGIDGIIKEDRLGLDVIYVQAKRWDHTVGRPGIQRFAGALQGQRARKGIFLTTSDFSQEAEDYAKAIENKIILVDGKTLAQAMIDFNVGVSADRVYEVKKIDMDYFEEE